MVHIPASALQIAAVIFAVRFVAGEAAFERASRRGDVGIFRPVLGLRILFGVGITLVILTAAEEGIRPSNLLSYVLLFAMMIGVFLVIPGTILVDSTSIRETRWFGLRRVEIPWSDVAYAGDDADYSVTVRSKAGQAIQHTRYHVDRRAFITALKQYCENCVYNDPAYKPWVPLSSR